MIATFEVMDDPKWSFVSTNEKGNVTEVREKEQISNQATSGVYMWRQGKHFVQCAEQMIENNIRVRGEFYTAPVYNESIKQGGVIRSYTTNAMYGVGTPKELEDYLSAFHK
jgi:dTDP-glucose pyrophosphorylase